MQETQVQSLVWEDPTCHGTTKLVCHNYGACALEPVLHSKRNYSSGKPAPPPQRVALSRHNYGKACTAMKTRHSQKKKNFFLNECIWKLNSLSCKALLIINALQLSFKLTFCLLCTNEYGPLNYFFLCYGASFASKGCWWAWEDSFAVWFQGASLAGSYREYSCGKARMLQWLVVTNTLQPVVSIRPGPSPSAVKWLWWDILWAALLATQRADVPWMVLKKSFTATSFGTAPQWLLLFEDPWSCHFQQSQLWGKETGFFNPS